MRECANWHEGLAGKVDMLCSDLTREYERKWPTISHGCFYDYTVGKKYIRICYNEGSSNVYPKRSVWGFIAKHDFKVKNKKKTGGEFIEFKEGDVLMSAGWRTPRLNAPRGNLLKGYPINTRRIHGPEYLI